MFGHLLKKKKIKMKYIYKIWNPFFSHKCINNLYPSQIRIRDQIIID